MVRASALVLVLATGLLCAGSLLPLVAAQDNATAAGDEIPSSAPKKNFENLSEAQTALREKLLTNYDRGAQPPYVPPEDEDGENATEAASEPTLVEVGINFHRVLDVDVVRSEINLLVWMRFIWTDERLAWNPDDYNGLDKMWFWVEDGAGLSETSEIWTPDLELWNMKESIKKSFSNSFASVSSDGRVFWSRPGHLNPVCKFRGLSDFPFDKLSCVVEIGSWSYSGKYLRLKPFEYAGNDGFSIGGSETSGEAFTEFKLDNVTAELVIYPPYPADPLADWPVLLYTISFERSWQPYIRGYLVSQMIFNVIGFACFWLPVQSGERLALAITAMLSAVAADLVVVSKLPSAAELTWMQKFSLMSQVFAAYCVLEGVVISYFYFQTASDLVPAYLRLIFSGVRRRHPSGSRARKRKDKTGSGVNLAASTDTEASFGSGVSELEDSANSSDNHFRAPSLRPRDADDFQHRRQIKNNAYWKRWATTIDDISRVVIPTSYVVIVAIFLAQVA